MKDLIVKGENRYGVSTAEMPLIGGGTALFRDIDEMSGGIKGIVAIACGSFSVSKAESGYTIKHGMSVAPDVWAIIPKHWHDTIDNNLAILVGSKYAHTTGGRRALEGSTTHFQGGLDDDSTDISVEINVTTSTLAKFQPTYTDADGNTGTQEYLWIAVKFAEEAV